jgi:hypothetical protein
MDAVVRRKIPSLRWESNPRTPIVQLVVLMKIFGPKTGSVSGKFRLFRNEKL